MKYFFLFVLFAYQTVAAQNTTVPDYYQHDKELSEKLHEIVVSLELDGDFPVGADGVEQISLAVIQIDSASPRLSGVNFENFIYPASVYKMYVAAEVLRQISNGEYSLDSPYIVKSPNDVDTRKEITSDPRPLIHHGDTVTVNYLLDLMITRSDNSAANCLIDLANRNQIDDLIHSYGWEGSEVTRKFLSREYEDPGYEDIRGTMTSALHAADFMYLVYENKLVNPWVSMQLKTLLGRQLDKSKLSAGLPDNVMYYHKTGWFSTWTHDVGIVDDGNTAYVIAVFLPLREKEALPKFKKLAEQIQNLLKI